MATRYPKAGKGREWTIKELDALKADARGDTLSDGGGLYGEVRVSKAGVVSVGWLYKYRCPIKGKVDEIGCGTYPGTSMADIRKARNTARDLVGEGLSPKQARELVRIEAQQALAAKLAEAAAQAERELTVRDLFNDWIKRVKRKDGNEALKRSMERDLLEAHGDRPVRSLRDQHLYQSLEAILQRRAGTKRPGYRTVDVTLKNYRQMFSWAERRQPWRELMSKGNPALVIELHEALPRNARPDVPRERTLSDAELRELAAIFPAMRKRWEEAHDRRRARKPMHPRTEIAVWLCASTLTRIGALELAEWEHVNLEARQWFIPAANQKETAAQKEKPQDLVIELSDFACRWFRRLHELTGTGRWCLPQPDGKRPIHKIITRQIGDRQAMFSENKNQKGRAMTNDLVLAGGTTGKWTLHDLRRTGATIMESLGVAPIVIDRCQGHATHAASGTAEERRLAQVRRHYLHHPYRDEMRDAFDRLGKHLEAVLAPKLRKAA